MIINGDCRNPFLNQVVSVLCGSDDCTCGDGRNPFLNQVVSVHYNR